MAKPYIHDFSREEQSRLVDQAITIWMLEHVNEPKRILREALRVLKPGGFLICTEVDNSTFGFEG